MLSIIGVQYSEAHSLQVLHSMPQLFTAIQNFHIVNLLFWSILRQACLYVCLSVCLSGRVSQKPHVQTSRNVMRMLSKGVARSSSDDDAICYVLPVLWMTSCLPIMRHLDSEVAHVRRSFNLIRQGAPAAYTITMKRLRTALASAVVVVVTFANYCVAIKWHKIITYRLLFRLLCDVPTVTLDVSGAVEITWFLYFYLFLARKLPCGYGDSMHSLIQLL